MNIASTKTAKLEMLIGFPCSGKSTFLETKLMRVSPTFTDLVVVSSDRYIDEAAQKLGIGYAEAFPMFIKDATKKAKASVVSAIESSHDVIWDQTNLTKEVRTQRLNRFPSKTYLKVGYVFPVEDPAILFERMKRLRPEKIVPLDVLYEMRAKYEEPSLDEGFDSLIVLNIKF